MITPQFLLPIHSELVVDLFAGGGGASTGIELAIGRPVDIAINHDPEAVSLHQANHPQTQHYVSDVFEVDPLVVTDGQPVGLLWASPDCKHFSKAKGGKPVSKKIRSLAWVVIKWAKAVAPRVICLENVEEFQHWGPLTDGKPCLRRRGHTFQRWVSTLRNLGYVVEWRELRACDYGAPTIRKRLFLVARCDGAPIVWPEPTHGAPGNLGLKTGKLKPWRTAAECIDWTIPVPSIFERNRPLADATCRRIAKGVMRYVVDCAEPFIVPTLKEHHDNSHRLGVHQHGPILRGRGRAHVPVSEDCDGTEGAHVFRADGSAGPQDIARHEIPSRKGLDRPELLGAVPDLLGLHGHAAQRGRLDALAVPTIISMGHGERPGQQPRVPGIEAPHSTITAQGQHSALVTAFLAKHYGGVVGSSLEAPIGTVTSVDHHSLVAANMITIDNQSSTGGTTDAGEPLRTTTVENRHALVTSHLAKLRGTNVGSATDEPLHTVSAQGLHHAEVRAFLVKYYGSDQAPELREPLHTVTTRDRFGLVSVKGQPYAIVDIGLRMLSPRELYRAQGFPESYHIDTGADGRQLTKTAQVRMCGNSVCPPMAQAIVAANYSEVARERIAA